MVDERLDFLRRELESLSQPGAATPDLSAVGTAGGFRRALRTFYTTARKPPLADRAGNVLQSEMHSAMVGSSALPPLDAVTAVVKGCGGSEEELAAFTAAWQRIAGSAKN